MQRFYSGRALPVTTLIMLAAGTIHAADVTSTTDTAPSAATVPQTIDEITITAKRLNEARSSIQTRTGASTYTIDAEAIASTPGGDNTLLNQVIMQSPEVAQDSFGQFHIRGEHNGLQYRLNGIILPEGISVFGQSLDPRLISSMSIITGALPAEYGLRTAGIIDLTTKSGTLEPGGSISLYGGSHGQFEPSVNYGGTHGTLTYFVTGGLLRNDLGIESPDNRSNPLHDRTTQAHGFAYLENILNEQNRVTFILATSTAKFQIPNTSGGQPGLGLTVNGQTAFPSKNFNENQREVTRFGIASLQHSAEPLDVQTSFIVRYSSLSFAPDPLGDLLYNGLSTDAFKRNVAYAWQTDGAYKLSDTHTLRAGLYLQSDKSTSMTTSQVLPTDPVTGLQTTDVPRSIIDNGAQTEWIESVYLQDEWKLAQTFTLNYGLRVDHFTAFTKASQASPRLNMVWTPFTHTTIHAGYSRYLSPPPFELVGNETIAKFQNTTAAPAVTQNDKPKEERANYFDFGIHQQIAASLTVGLDAYYKRSRNLIDEGQFGAPIILTTFNYADGKQSGVELTMNYAGKALSAYASAAVQSAKGRNFASAQFNFAPDNLAYVARHYIDLDHEQRLTGSGGVSYRWRGTRFSADFLYGSGLRASLNLPDGTIIPNGAHLPYYTQVNLGLSHAFHSSGLGALTARVDVINAFDKVYQIRNGTGVGVGAPQFGPRRGVFFGISKELGSGG